ncbi:MAG: malonate decarboxylase acyl carrier protein [Burkholderiales bacterium]
MEQMRFKFEGGGLKGAQAATLVGVVASGNLEVLMEKIPMSGACEITISTAARGFGDIWKAVLEDFFARHPLADVRVSINDMGATPAVVSLRLDQAAEEFVAT